MGIDSSSVVRQGPDQVAADVDGEVVMMSVERGHYFGLDAVGSRIWALLEQPRRVDELCTQLAREYDVERTTCEADVLAFLDEMLAQGLISVDDAAG